MENYFGLDPATLASEASWAIATVLWLTALVVILERYEFNLRFESLFHRLRPDDLSDPAYTRCFGDLLPFHRAIRTREQYKYTSLLFVVGLSLISAHSNFLDALRVWLLPAGISNWLSAPDIPVFERTFRHLLFWGSALHLFPLISVVSASRARRLRDGSERANSAVAVLSAVFLIQQYYLDMMVGYLLRCSLSPHSARPIRGSQGSVIHLAQSRIAERMREDTASIVVRGQRQEDDEGIGVGAAAIQGRDLAIADERAIIVTLIEQYGIPDVRQRLGWKLKRKTHRQEFPAPARIEVGAVDGDRIGTLNAWSVDIGADRAGGMWRSILLRIRSPEERFVRLAKEQDSLRLEGLGGRSIGKRPIQFQIMRRDMLESAEGRTLFLGAVVQHPQAKDFNRLIHRSRSILNAV